MQHSDLLARRGRRLALDDTVEARQVGRRVADLQPQPIDVGQAPAHQLDRLGRLGNDAGKAQAAKGAAVVGRQRSDAEEAEERDRQESGRHDSPATPRRYQPAEPQASQQSEQQQPRCRLGDSTARVTLHRSLEVILLLQRRQQRRRRVNLELFREQRDRDRRPVGDCGDRPERRQPQLRDPGARRRHLPPHHHRANPDRRSGQAHRQPDGRERRQERRHRSAHPPQRRVRSPSPSFFW